MRFLMDANMPQMLTTKLRGEGHDVEEVLEWNPGTDDPSILQHAREQQRILITADLWFGNIRAHPVGSYPGLILIRPKTLRPQEMVELVAQGIDEFGERLSGKLIIVDRNRTRIRGPEQA